MRSSVIVIRLDEPEPTLATRFHGGDLDTSVIERHPVLSRWTRAASLGLRADTDAYTEAAPSDDLAVRRDRADAIFREETPLLAPMAAELASRSMVAIVADHEGVILLARGGGEFASDAMRVRLVEGSRWSERARGTNAIGTAIAERRSVAVVGRAHFEERNHGLFCYATPILDPYGDLAAVLDVTGPAHEHNPAIGIAVQAAGGALARALRLREHAAATAGGYAIVERMLHRARSPAMLVEANGDVTAMNDAARLALGIAGDRALTAERVFGASMEALRAVALSPNGGARFETARAAYRLEIEPIFGSGRRILALVVYLDPLAQTAPQTPVIAGPSREHRRPDPAPLPAAFDAILGTDQAVIEAKRMAARFAPTALPILLLAETGTGKELFARALHAAGSRAKGPFVALNCGALNPSLLESELFGYAPGAFTGARRGGSDGKIGAANGGTLFLDEVAEMPEPLQAMLLRVLEEGSYYRVGGAEERRSDMRLVCATCRDLPALVVSGAFRRDLFFRIQGAVVTIPPLRARDDRLHLARGLLAQIAKSTNVACPDLGDDAAAYVLSHRWPGNVRELKSALAHALVMAEGAPSLAREHFPRVLFDDTAGARDAPRTRDEILDDAVADAVQRSGGNLSEAARLLGVARSTLYRRMNKKG